MISDRDMREIEALNGADMLDLPKRMISEQGLLLIDMEARYTAWKLDDVAAAKRASDHDLRRLFAMIYKDARSDKTAYYAKN